jgi:TonB family protein
MMNTLITWFVEANIAFLVLYLFYIIFLKRDTFFKEKRLTFILGFLFAILYPLIDLSIWIQNLAPAKDLVNTLNITLQEITITPDKTSYMDAVQALTGIYATISLLLLCRILWQTAAILNLAIRGEKESYCGLNIIHLPNGYAPFSFFGCIFINPKDYCTQDLYEILQHEKTHVNQLHTLDVLFTELICVVFWINPCIWLLKHAMRVNLEYLADNKVLHSGIDQKSYQYHLLRLSYQETTTTMGNYFNVSQLKNRIIMMNKKKTSQAGLSKYALTLPLFVMLLFSAYAYSLGEKQKPTLSEKQKPSKVIQTEKIYTGVEVMPQFPGGEEALKKFIKENIKYPAIAAKKGISGRVTMRFVVSKTGNVTGVEVVRGLDSSCDKEAIRVMKLMPKWIPGKLKGLNVPVYFTLPIQFKS